MKHRLYILINRARHDLQLAEELARAEVAKAEIDDGLSDAAADLHEVRARVLALEARVGAIEERSKE